MKAIKHNRNIIATTLAVGLGLAGNSAFAMTSDHDTVPAGKDGKGAILADTDTGARTVAENVIGGKVGVLTLKDVSK